MISRTQRTYVHSIVDSACWSFFLVSKVRCGESIDDVTAQCPLKSSSCSLSHSLQYAQGHAAHGGSHHAILDCQRRNGVLLDVWKLARTHLQTSNHRAAIASDTKLYARTVSSSRSTVACVSVETFLAQRAGPEFCQCEHAPNALLWRVERTRQWPRSPTRRAMFTLRFPIIY